MGRKKPLPIHPREAWVLEAPDGYVMRRLLPHAERTPGETPWFESEMVDLRTIRTAARVAKRRAVRGALFYAVRRNEETGESHIAFIDQKELIT